MAAMEGLGRRFGIPQLEITREQFRKAGDLIDDLVASDPQVRRTGAFVARLRDPALRTDEFVAGVKQLARDDRNFKVFKPLLIKRQPLWKEVGTYCVMTESEGESKADRKTMCTLRRQFAREFLSQDFKALPNTDLNRVFETQGVDACIEAFYQKLDAATPILYAANMDPHDMPPSLKSKVDVNFPISGDIGMENMDSLIQHLGGGRHPGIVTPTLYVGTEGSLFQCHREDVSLQAVNMHVAGAPKIWFVIPPRYHDAFLEEVKKLGIAKEDRKCALYLQHKFFFCDPRTILSRGIPVHTIVQKQGDIVYLLPNAIHFGFNLGWNINQAVNVASKTYALPGMLSNQRCHCDDVNDIYYEFDIKGILKAAGISDEMIQRYDTDELAPISDELELLFNDLHPQTGRRNDTEIKPEDLLGPAMDDEEQLGKFWRRMTLPTRGPGVFVGGLHDLTVDDDEEDEEEPGPSNEGAGQQQPDDEEEDDGQVQKTKYQCPECEFQVAYRGQRASDSLVNHVKKSHPKNAEDHVAAILLNFTKKEPAPSTFQCCHCSKQFTGGRKRRADHEEKCGKKKLAKEV